MCGVKSHELSASTGTDRFDRFPDVDGSSMIEASNTNDVVAVNRDAHTTNSEIFDPLTV